MGRTPSKKPVITRIPGSPGYGPGSLESRRNAAPDLSSVQNAGKDFAGEAARARRKRLSGKWPPKIRQRDIKLVPGGATVNGLTDRATMLTHSPHVRRSEILSGVRRKETVFEISRVLGVSVFNVKKELNSLLENPNVSKADKAKIRGLLGK